MKIVIIGPPTSGKGTQSKLIKSEMGLVHVSTGDIFRNILKKENKISKSVEKYQKNTLMVPDKLTIRILKNYLKEKKINDNYVLDGYPRTLTQAKDLLKSKKVDHMIILNLEYDDALKRMEERLMCSECMKTYKSVNTKMKCNECGGDLIKRNDDTEDNLKKRFIQYDTETVGAIKFLKGKINYTEIDARLDSDEIFKQIKGKVG